MVSPPNFNVRFFEPRDAQLFSGLLEQLPLIKLEEVIVQPLSRIGFSGAKVFAFFPRGPNSFPYVAKTHSSAGIQRELDGLERAFSLFADANQKAFHKIDGDRGIVATPLVGQTIDGKTQPQITELYDLLFVRNPEVTNPADRDNWYQIPTSELIKHFDKLYADAMQQVVRSATKASGAIKLEEEYSWYLRKNASAPKLRTWLETQAESSRLNLENEAYPNPLKYVEELRRKELQIVQTTVHGDLHPMNVLFDHNGVAHLIDFTWCAAGAHILKDFLVMECSIRFLMMPTHLGPKSQLALDCALLDPSETAIADVTADLRKSGVDEPTLLHVERCGAIMQNLRKHAEAACQGCFKLEDYLACQAIVLYGLMAIEKYPFDHCARALATICRRLDELSYV